jgi:hypothetical protein
MLLGIVYQPRIWKGMIDPPTNPSRNTINSGSIIP